MPSVSAQPSATAQRRCRQPRSSRRSALHLPKASAKPWKSARATNAVERLHEQFKRRIKTQTVLASSGYSRWLLRRLLLVISSCARSMDGRRLQQNCRSAT
jgi:predicted GTPase